MLFYFEDKGIAPTYHQIQAGDNIRTVATSLLGHRDSWKEIWATNSDLESKGNINQGQTIKYWPVGADSQPAESEVEEESEEEPSVPPAMEEEPQSAPSDEGLAEEEEEGPAPAPPISETTPDDPIEDSSSPSLNGEKSANMISGFSQTDIAIAGLLAVFALILTFSLIRKKLKKKADFDYTAVNYEINE